MYKFNKESLLEESQNVGFADVDFDSLFESLGIEDEDAKASLQEAFMLASRNGAVQLTEAHLTKMAEFAQGEIDQLVESAQVEFDNKLQESIDDLLISVSKEWLNENQLAVENTVKAQQFDSIMTDLKESFIAHNFSVPEAKIDLYEELAVSEREAHGMADKIFKENLELKNELNTIKRDQLIESLSVNMVDTKKEQFTDLARAIKLDESYATRVVTLSESFIGGFSTKSATPEQKLVESLKTGATVDTKKTEEKSLNESKGNKVVETPKIVDNDFMIRNL